MKSRADTMNQSQTIGERSMHQVDTIYQNSREAISESILIVVLLIGSRRANNSNIFNRKFTKLVLFKWFVFFTCLNIVLKSISKEFDKSLFSAGVFNVATLLFLPLKK